MAQKYVGIDLGTHRVKIAVMTGGFRGAQLVDTFEEPVLTAVTGQDGKVDEADPYLPALQAALVDRDWQVRQAAEDVARAGNG